jgi:acetyl-CoA C-acetyltransferase
MNDVFVVGAARTAIGSFGGGLKDVPLSGLAATAVAAALDRSSLPGRSAVGHLVMGNVIPTEARDAYLSRVAAIEAGLPDETPAFNVNRLCGSGLQAVISAAQAVALGDTEIAVGAGAESMSRSPHLMPMARWGNRMGDAYFQDYMLGILNDPFHRVHMGVTAENVATRFGISREDQDKLALESHRRASHRSGQNYFQQQIVPVRVPKRSGYVELSSDEHFKPDASLEALSSLRPAFKSDGSVTAGNSSGLNDGAAAVVLASSRSLREHDLKPLARIVSYAHAGVEPEYMGIGPVPASRIALKRAGMSLADIDLVEANEAFAAQALAVTRELDLDPARVNPNGSGISLGHPVGATGAILVVKAVYELQRSAGRYALVTMCIGGGQGIALVLERC